MKPQFTAHLLGEEIVVDLVLQNQGDKAVDVLLYRGSDSAISLHGQLQQWALKPVEVADRQWLTRAGPRLVWRPVPAGGQLAADTYRLTLPPEARSLLPLAATFSASLETNLGPTRLTGEAIIRSAR